MRTTFPKGSSQPMRAIRSLVSLNENASTARTLNLVGVWRKHGDSTPEYRTCPFFRNSILNRSIIVKHRLRPLTAAPVSTMAGATLSSDVGSANGQGAKRQFLSDAKAQDYVTNPLRQPESPWEVKAGSIISAALLTAINSDLPGEVIAQVTEPVYDHATGRTVLIPQGSRLIGIYDSQISYGQERALVAWTRIIMPNGTSMNLGSMSGGDLSGAAGMKDQVDARFWQMARGVLLSTVFSVGAASAQDASARSSGELVINSAGSGISNGAQQIGLQLTQRDLNRQPIIKIRPGWPLSVLVSKDMVLSPYP